MRSIFLSLALLLTLTSSAFALTYTNIDLVRPIWVVGGIGDGNPAESYYSLSTTETFGQTFSLPSSILLNSVSFLTDDSMNYEVVDFQLGIGTWTGSMVGTELWLSDPMSTSNNGGQGGWEEITVDTQGTLLAGGGDYVIFITASNLVDGLKGTMGIPTYQESSGDTVTSGNVVYMNSDDQYSALFNTPFASFQSDILFTIDYSLPGPSAVPEPSTVALLLAGFAGLIGYGLKRRS